jgi:hypothetical protein
MHHHLDIWAVLNVIAVQACDTAVYDEIFCVERSYPVYKLEMEQEGEMLT